MIYNSITYNYSVCISDCNTLPSDTKSGLGYILTCLYPGVKVWRKNFNSANSIKPVAWPAG